MSWEFALPNLLAGDAERDAEPAADLSTDGDAFAAFYSRSARPLWAYLARVSGDPALADDLMQESYVRFLCAERPEALLVEGEVAARKYLFRIATNLLRDHWRRPHSASLDEVGEEALAAKPAHSDLQAMTATVLGQLRSRDRQLLWLAHAEGYSHKEIAEITGLAGASIRLLLFRARRRAARLLEEQGSTRGGER